MRGIAGVGIAALAVLAIVVVLAASGCGDDGAGSASAPPTTPATTGAPAPDRAGIMLADTGLSIGQAQSMDIDGTIAVRVYVLVAEDGSARLCDEMRESFPPQCGGPAVAVTGLPEEFVAGLTEGGGQRWSDVPVQLLGTLQGDVFVNDPEALASG